MKLRKLIPILITVILVLSLLVSCSGDSTYENSAPSDSGAIGGTITGAVQDRKIIREYYITLETTEFNKTIQELRDAVIAVGGYEEDSRVNPPSVDDRGYASIKFAVPTDAVDTFNQKISGVGKVREQTVTSRDVTLSYADVEARIESLEAEEARIYELYNTDPKPSLEESMRITERLGEISAELGSYRKQLAALEKQVSMTSYKFTVHDVAEYTEGEQGFFPTLWEAFGEGAEFFGVMIQGLLIVLAFLWPFILIILVIIVILLLVFRKKIVAAAKARKARRAELKAKAEEAEHEGNSPAEETPPSATPAPQRTFAVPPQVPPMAPGVPPMYGMPPYPYAPAPQQQRPVPPPTGVPVSPSPVPPPPKKAPEAPKPVQADGKPTEEKPAEAKTEKNDKK